MESSIRPGTNKVIIKRKLNFSTKAILSVILFSLSHILYGMLFFLTDQKNSDYLIWNELKSYIFYLSIILLFVTLIYAQNLFNIKTNKKTLNKLTKKENLQLIAVYYNIKTGFKRFYRYILPFILYIVAFTYTLILIESLYFKPGQFNAGSGGLLFMILVWLIFTSLGVGLLFHTYTAHSHFIEIYDKIIVVRNLLKIHYIPAERLEAIGYYRKKGGDIRRITFEVNEAKTIKLDLNYLIYKGSKIQKCLNSQYKVKTRSGWIGKR